jgi:hypothetical protein
MKCFICIWNRLDDAYEYSVRYFDEISFENKQEIYDWWNEQERLNDEWSARDYDLFELIDVKEFDSEDECEQVLNEYKKDEDYDVWERRW